MNNRFRTIYGVGLRGADGNGMEAVPTLAPGEPTPDVKLKLRELADAWRDARFRQESARTTTLAIPPGLQHQLKHAHRRAADEVEWEAARLALIHAGVMFADESRPPWTFRPVVVAFGAGQSIRVEPRAGGGPPHVWFTPSDPVLLSESLS